MSLFSRARSSASRASASPATPRAHRCAPSRARRHPGSRHHRRQHHHRSRRVRRHHHRRRRQIDNLCQIAHNVTVGRGAILAAFAGISGSVEIGDAATLAGRVGVGDHRKIGAGATLAGAAAVGDDVPPGEIWMGYPAKPIRTFLREVRWVARKAAGGRDGEK